MARTSYGGDIFSPIRSDLSLNDSVFLKEESSRKDSISEELKTVSPIKSSKNIYSIGHSRKNGHKLPLEEVTLLHKNNKVGNKYTKRNEETVSKSNLLSACVKDANSNSELPLRRSPRITRRSRKKDGEITEKSTGSKDSNSLSSNKQVSSQISKKKENDSTRNFITFRGRESKKTECVGTKGCSVNVSVTHSEVLEEKENSYKVPVHNDSSTEIKGAVTETSVATVLSNEEVVLSPIKEICEMNLKISSNKIDTEPNGDSFGEILPSGPAGIQIKVIEKLVSDSMSAQFDVIRKQMYQQQMCILKVLNETKAEMEEKYTRDTENLHQIIQALAEENRLLRSAIFARQ